MGLRQMLSEELRNLVFGEAKSSDEAVARLSKQPPWDLVILAIVLPGKDGFYVLEEIRRLYPSTRVLLLSMQTDSNVALHARQLGAYGYICENAGRADLLRAVKHVLAGKKYFRNLPSPESHVEAAPLHAGLSTREYEVLLAFVAGKRPGQIATDLGLSIKTVSTYKRRLLDKLGLRSIADLVRYAIDHRLSADDQPFQVSGQ